VSFYREFFLDDAHRILDVEEFTSASDRDALERAFTRFRVRNGFAGFELWQERRPVRLVPRPKGRDCSPSHPIEIELK
jgi:hypothetical protein